MARRRHSNRRHRGGSFGFLYKVLSMLVICGAIVAALTLFFRVGTVVVTGQERYTAEEVREASGVAEGDNLILLNKHTVAHQLVEKLPYIEEVHPYRRLPDTLIIEVKECGEPLAVLQDGFAWLVSPGGKIVEQRGLPRYQRLPAAGSHCGDAHGPGYGVRRPAAEPSGPAGCAGAGWHDGPGGGYPAG